MADLINHQVLPICIMMNQEKSIFGFYQPGPPRPMKGDSMKTSNTRDEDIAMSDEYDFSTGLRGRFFQSHKIATTIRIDNDVVMYFKKMSSETKQGYQTLMNNALRAYINTHEDNTASR